MAFKFLAFLKGKKAKAEKLPAVTSSSKLRLGALFGKKSYLAPPEQNVKTYSMYREALAMLGVVLLVELLLSLLLVIAIYGLFPLELPITKIIYDTDMSETLTVADKKMSDGQMVALSVKYLKLVESIHSANGVVEIEKAIKILNLIASPKLYQTTWKRLVDRYRNMVELDVIRAPFINEGKVISRSANKAIVELNGVIVDKYVASKEIYAYRFTAKLDINTAGSRIYSVSDKGLLPELGYEIDNYELVTDLEGRFSLSLDATK